MESWDDGMVKLITKGRVDSLYFATDGKTMYTLGDKSFTYQKR